MKTHEMDSAKEYEKRAKRCKALQRAAQLREAFPKAFPSCWINKQNKEHVLIIIKPFDDTLAYVMECCVKEPSETYPQYPHITVQLCNMSIGTVARGFNELSVEDVTKLHGNDALMKIIESLEKLMKFATGDEDIHNVEF